MTRRTILLADDHPAWCTLLHDSLNNIPTLVVQGSVGSKRGALAAINDTPPDLLVLDIRLSDGYSLDLCQHVQRAGLSVCSLVLTAHDDDAYLARALAGGALGYLLKTEALATIVEAIQRAAQGETLWTHYQLLRARYWQQVAGDKWAALTERERQIVAALVHFETDAEIAEDLNVSPRTVHHHLNHILVKLDMGSRREVARWAVRYKLVELWPPLPGVSDR
jgi:DNA-binding NarL/FixJ family response regulator